MSKTLELVPLDFSAAFDTLDYIASSSCCMTKPHSPRLVHFTFVGRTNSIKIRDVTSVPVINQLGVPQGSVLCPLLFNIYL